MKERRIAPAPRSGVSCRRSRLSHFREKGLKVKYKADLRSQIGLFLAVDGLRCCAGDWAGPVVVQEKQVISLYLT
jgi:hypothetical protein